MMTLRLFRASSNPCKRHILVPGGLVSAVEAGGRLRRRGGLLPAFVRDTLSASPFGLCSIPTAAVDTMPSEGDAGLYARQPGTGRLAIPLAENNFGYRSRPLRGNTLSHGENKRERMKLRTVYSKAADFLSIFHPGCYSRVTRKKPIKEPHRTAIQNIMKK